MEIIFEIFYELIIGVAVEIIKDKEYSIVVRIVAGAILFILFGGIIALLIYAAWDLWLFSVKYHECNPFRRL